MIISAKNVLELNVHYKLIENMDEREQNPEGVGIDIRVGEVYKLKGKGFLGVTERETPGIEKIADIKDGTKKITINPGEFRIVKTMERVNLPSEKIKVDGAKKGSHIMADVYPRSTLQRSGIYLMATKTDPGYSGELTFAMLNVGGVPFELELGARVANIVFHQVTGDLARAYGGQWHGGRVATTGKEKQI